MRQQRKDHTLQATGLVHEAYLKMVHKEDPSWEDQRHFMGVAVYAMRSILVDHSRKKSAAKRKAGEHRVAIDHVAAEFQDKVHDLVALNEALEELARIDPTMARVVEFRFFGGFSVQETADFLGLSRRTTERNWTMARAWLFGALDGS